MMVTKRRWLLVSLACAPLACGASGDALSSSAERGAFPGDPTASGATAGGASSDAAAPERELESLYEAPVATGRYVWTANPRSGRVAFVDATTLAVRTLEAGNQPTFLATVPPTCAPKPCDDDKVIVLNSGSKDATLIGVGATLDVATVPVPSGGNRWAVAPNGLTAIAWTDARREASAPKTLGFQDVCIVDLATRRSTVLAVGYRPVAIGFSAAGDKAFAVTQDGVSVVELATASGPRVSKNVALSDAPLEDPGSRDVSLTPDGAYALVRRDGASTVTVISLVDGTRKTVTLDGPVTDLDLGPNGDRAIAVVRSTAKAVILPIPQIWNDPLTFDTVTLPGETVGSVAFAPEGSRALLYTTDSSVERMSVLDFSTTPATTRPTRLYSPVLAAFLAPSGAHAVVFHPPVSASAGGPATSAFSLVPLSAELPAKIVATEAPTMQVAIAPESDRAIITERDDRSKVYRASLASFPSLMVQRYTLASPPIAAGVAARSRRAFVAQEHPEGRITFIDFATGAARTLTGFELAARVVDGSVGR